MADELGVADRCVWDIRYIPDEEAGDLFAAADFGPDDLQRQVPLRERSAECRGELREARARLFR